MNETFLANTQKPLDINKEIFNGMKFIISQKDGSK